MAHAAFNWRSWKYEPPPSWLLPVIGSLRMLNDTLAGCMRGNTEKRQSARLSRSRAEHCVAEDSQSVPPDWLN
jgi:hypothetical protein